jgi:hypothetical protein
VPLENGGWWYDSWGLPDIIGGATIIPPAYPGGLWINTDQPPVYFDPGLGIGSGIDRPPPPPGSDPDDWPGGPSLPPELFPELNGPNPAPPAPLPPPQTRSTTPSYS